MNIHSEKILILDFGSQTTQLIARRIREQKVYSEIHPYTLPLQKIKEMQPKGIVLSGGPASVYDQDAPLSDPGLFDLDIPVLGICYGAQLMTQQLGGKVERAVKREFGKSDLEINYTGGLFAGLETGSSQYQVWMSHGDRVEVLPAGLCRLGGERALPPRRHPPSGEKTGGRAVSSRGGPYPDRHRCAAQLHFRPVRLRTQLDHA